jgi:hypothetical protein
MKEMMKKQHREVRRDEAWVEDHRERRGLSRWTRMDSKESLGQSRESHKRVRE